jgi:ABC-type antimicrobial peptide transport system permease subunit
MIIDYASIALKNLRRRGIRSWLTLLGIFIGIATVVSLISLGGGLRAAILSQFGISSTEVIEVQAGGLNSFGPPGTSVSKPLTIQDVDAISKLGPVETAIPRQIATVKVEFNKILNVEVATNIVDGNDRKILYDILGVSTLEGKLLEDGDVGKVVLGNNFYYEDKNGFNKQIRVGNSITINGKKYQVKGILEKKGSFIFLAMAVLGAYSALTKTTKVARLKTLTSAMAAKELEVVRNIAYTQIGTVNGNPHGSLPDQSNPRSTTLDGVGFRVYFEVTYIDDSADGTIVAGTDSAPNDYKQIKMFVFNTLTSETSTFLTNVSPKGLEGLSNAGALLIKVFDAVGQPISGVSVSIANNLLNPTINLQRTSDASGQVLEVGLPASVNGYHLVATKNGYTTAQTYPASVGNPNPINPDATIVDGVVTKVSLQIDLVSPPFKFLNHKAMPILIGFIA